jgi:hypothetical protein
MNGKASFCPKAIHFELISRPYFISFVPEIYISYRIAYANIDK